MENRNCSLKLLPFRLIPFDLGHEIDNTMLNGIRTYFNENNGWKVITDEFRGSNEVLFAQNNNLFIHLYKDGIGIFTLKDSPEIHENWKDFDPNKTMNLRKKSHKEILTHTHKLSGIIQNTIDRLKTFFDHKKMRFSALPEWENRGLSYVMSFYFIKCDPSIIRDKDIQRKLASFLFPYYDERKDIDYVDDKTINYNFNENFIRVVQRNYEILPYLHTCASWSNFLIVGRIDERIINEYWRMERGLQHVWYYTYIIDKFIEYSLKNINSSVPEKALNELDSMLTDMIFKINKYEGIISSTMHERDFKLYEALRTTSRLDLLIKNVEKKANILKDRYNWLLNEKRTKADKKIQFILFVIALISILGLYDTFIKIGIWVIIILITGSIVGLYLFKPFFK